MTCLTTLPLWSGSILVINQLEQQFPGSRIPLTDYTVRWTGALQPQFSEPYTFYTTTDDGVRLFIGGQELINEWNEESGPTSWSGTTNLVACDAHLLEMDYQDQGVAAVALPFLEQPSTPRKSSPQLNSILRWTSRPWSPSPTS